MSECAAAETEPGKTQGTVGMKYYLWTAKKQAPGTVGVHEYTPHSINLAQRPFIAQNQFWKERMERGRLLHLHNMVTEENQGSTHATLDARERAECQQEGFKQEMQMNKQGKCRFRLWPSLHIPCWWYSWWWEWSVLWYQVLACILPSINTNLMPLLVMWSGCIVLYLIKNSFLGLPGGKSIRQCFSTDQKWRGADEVL